MSEASLASRVNQNLGVQLMLQRFLPLQTKARLAATEKHHAIEFNKLKKYIFITKNNDDEEDSDYPDLLLPDSKAANLFDNKNVIDLDNGKKFFIYFSILNINSEKIARLNIQFATKMFFVDIDQPKMSEEILSSGEKIFTLKFKELNQKQYLNTLNYNDILFFNNEIAIKITSQYFKDYNFNGLWLILKANCDLSDPEDNYKATKLVKEFKEIIRKYNAGELKRSS